MKRNIALLMLVTSLWSNVLTSTNPSPWYTSYKASGSTQAGDTKAQTVHSVVTVMNDSFDVTSFFSTHKKEVALLAVAITIGLSLKYCSWVQGLVGIDTEAEIDDWRVFIQD